MIPIHYPPSVSARPPMPLPMPQSTAAPLISPGLHFPCPTLPIPGGVAVHLDPDGTSGGGDFDGHILFYFSTVHPLTLTLSPLTTDSLPLTTNDNIKTRISAQRGLTTNTLTLITTLTNLTPSPTGPPPPHQPQKCSPAPSPPS